MSAALSELWQRRLRYPLDDALAESLSAELSLRIRSFEHGPDRVVGQRAIRFEGGGLAFLSIELDGFETPVVRLVGQDVDRSLLTNSINDTEAAISRAERTVRPDTGPHGTAIWAPFAQVRESDLYRTLFPAPEPDGALFHWPGELGLDDAERELGAGLAIVVQSLEAAIGFAVENGGEVREVAPLFEGQCAVVTDPLGHPLLLWEGSLDSLSSGLSGAVPARVDAASPDPRPFARFYRDVAGWRTAVVHGEPIQALLTHHGALIGVVEERPAESWREVSLLARDPWPLVAGLAPHHYVGLTPFRHPLGRRWAIRAASGGQLWLAEEVGEGQLSRLRSWDLRSPSARAAVASLRAALDLLASTLRDILLAVPSPPRTYQIAVLTDILLTAFDPAVERVIDLFEEPAGVADILAEAIGEMRPEVGGLVEDLGATVASLGDETLEIAYGRTVEHLVRVALLRDDAGTIERSDVPT
jgi:hypothetical protein